MKPGDIVTHKRLPGSRARIIRWASEEECPASEECDLAPFEVEWTELHTELGFTTVGDRDMVCLHDLAVVQ